MVQVRTSGRVHGGTHAGRGVGRSAIPEAGFDAAELLDEQIDLTLVGLQGEHPIGHASQQARRGVHLRKWFHTERPLRQFTGGLNVIAHGRSPPMGESESKSAPTAARSTLAEAVRGMASTMRISVGSS